MATITLKTTINAPMQRCFDLSTSVDLHKISASKSKEEAIEGITEGLIELNETVTWKAKHFGIWHRMKVKITEFDRPNYFVDEMVNGSFSFMRHKHEFKQNENQTIMMDKFSFASPLGVLGEFVDKVIMRKYMENFLIERNKIIKEFAETDKWKQVLQMSNER